MIFPYTSKSLKLFDCPSAPLKNKPSWVGVPCYGYNGAVNGVYRWGISGGIDTKTSPCTLGEVNSPTRCILLLDYNVYWGIYANPLGINPNSTTLMPGITMMALTSVFAMAMQNGSARRTANITGRRKGGLTGRITLVILPRSTGGPHKGR